MSLELLSFLNSWRFKKLLSSISLEDKQPLWTLSLTAGTTSDSCYYLVFSLNLPWGLNSVTTGQTE